MKYLFTIRIRVFYRTTDTNGGPGTVYLENAKHKVDYSRRLIINKGGIPGNNFVYFNESNSYFFDVLHLYEGASIAMHTGFYIEIRYSKFI